MRVVICEHGRICFYVNQLLPPAPCLTSGKQCFPGSLFMRPAETIKAASSPGCVTVEFVEPIHYLLVFILPPCFVNYIHFFPTNFLSKSLINLLPSSGVTYPSVPSSIAILPTGGSSL